MNIIYIEPYYSGSHKKWIDSYKKYSKHNIKILSLPGNKWKWRMHGGAISLANQFLRLNQKIDLVLCSDFLNLPVFKSICDKKLYNIPIGMYFHENQLSYPWSPKDNDLKLKRDLHYHFINYSSSLAANFNLFNSNFHLDSYILSLSNYLKKMPDHNNFETINIISKKSSVLYIGCELNKFIDYKIKKGNDIPLVLWNHRWEFDKNPELFFNTLIQLKKEGIAFELAVLGESFKKYPEIFDQAREELSSNIVHFGYLNSFSEYAKWLWKADILPVTSNQDFFGISIIEATFCNVLPILPQRLSYPELFDFDNHKSLFYKNDQDFYQLLKGKILERNNNKSVSYLTEKYDWNKIVLKYDKTLSSFK